MKERSDSPRGKGVGSNPTQPLLALPLMRHPPRPVLHAVMAPVHLTAHDLDPPRFRYIAEPAIRRLFSPLRARSTAASAPPDPSNLHSQTFQEDGTRHAPQPSPHTSLCPWLIAQRPLVCG